MDLLLHIANLFLLISFSVKSMLWLRALNILAGGFFIAWAVSYSPPIWSSVAWNILFGLVNMWRIYVAILERRPPRLSAEEQRLHKAVFSELTARDVRSLFDLGQWENGLPPEMLCEVGTISPRVWMVADGEITVRKADRMIRTIKPGDFVGEASFLARKPLAASVVIESPVRFLSWSTQDLERFMSERPEVASGLQRILSACLVRKLDQVNQAA